MTLEFDPEKLTSPEALERLRARAARLDLSVSQFGSPPRLTLHRDRITESRSGTGPASEVRFGTWGLTVREANELLGLLEQTT